MKTCLLIVTFQLNVSHIGLHPQTMKEMKLKVNDERQVDEEIEGNRGNEANNEQQVDDTINESQIENQV